MNDFLAVVLIVFSFILGVVMVIKWLEIKGIHLLKDNKGKVEVIDMRSYLK